MVTLPLVEVRNAIKCEARTRTGDLDLINAAAPQNRASRIYEQQPLVFKRPVRGDNFAICGK
jgi:hypothetical protein